MKLIARCAFVVVLLCATAWAKDPTKELQKRLFKAAQGGDLAIAEATIGELAALDTEEAAEALLESSVMIDAIPNLQPRLSIGIHDAIAGGLKSFDDDAARSFLLDQLTSKRTDWRAKVLLVEVAEDFASDEADAALVEALGAKKQPEKVLLELCRAVGRRQVVRAVNPLIDLVDKFDKRRNDIWIESRLALNAITGLDLESVDDWRRYWADDVEESFRPETGGYDRDSGSTVVLDDAPEFFGTEVLSKRIVIVIDISGSMEAVDPYTGGTSDGIPGVGSTERMRIERAKQEMVRLVESLTPDIRFTLIKFSTQVSVWENELQSASESTKRKAVSWAKAITAEGVTNTGDALDRAFEIEGDPNLFFLISDGSPTDETGTPLMTDKLDEIHDAVAALNKFRKVRIDTIGFPGANTSFMSRLADENDGEFFPLD